MTLDDIRGLTAQLATDWAAVPDRENPTLDCQADWLTTLDATATGYREFAGTGSTGKVVTEAASAVLDFADADAARTAYDTVAGWIATCEDRLDGVRPIFASYDPVTMRTGYGPATWRVVESPAPELCTECDTGWIDSQGVALVGNRVALLSIAYTGDQTSGADTATSPMATGIVTAARKAAGGAGACRPATRPSVRWASASCTSGCSPGRRRAPRWSGGRSRPRDRATPSRSRRSPSRTRAAPTATPARTRA